MRYKMLTVACLIMTQPLQAQTLEEAIGQAIDNNPMIKQQYAKFESTVRDRDAASSNYYPTVNLHGGIGFEDTGYSSGTEVDEQLTRKELGLKVTQNLFNGFEDVSEVDRLAYEAESERLGLLSDAENLALDVARVYLNILKAEQILKLTENNVADHDKVLADIQVRQSQGLSSDSDLAQIQSRVATSKSSLLAAKNNLLDSRIEFMRIVGTKPENLTTPRADQYLLPKNEQEAIDKAIKNNPEIQLAMADLQAAHKEINRNEGDFYPDVNLEFHANYNDDINGYEGKDDDMRLMLTFSYDIYSGGNTVSKKESAIWRKEQARAVRMRTEQEVNEGVRLAWNAWSIQQQQLDWLQKNVDSAKATETGYQEQFKLNRRSLLDVLDAKVELFVARKNYIDTFYNQRLASYRLLNATGQLSYAMRVAYPEQWQQEVISDEDK